MRSRSCRAALGLVFAAILGLPTAGRAQAIKGQGISFESADGVDLQGTFYPSKNGGGSPSVILLHSPFKNPNDGDWAGLAQTLAGEGFNVLRFDFRGHGGSTDLKNKAAFWADPMNAAAMPTLAKKNPQPKTIAFKDFQLAKGYFPMLANDIMAARIALDMKNDANGTNTSSVYIIGATDAATLGMIYIAAEWNRPNILQQGATVASVPFNRNFWAPAAKEAGTDIAACVWLTAQRNTSVSADTIKKLVVNNPKIREENPMLFLCGAQDTTNIAACKYFLNEVLVANPPKTGPKKLDPLKYTLVTEVAKSKNTGVDLLGKDLGTEKTILDYLARIEKDRKNRLPVNRHYTKTPLISLPGLGVP